MVLFPVLHYPPVIGGLEQWEQNIAERQLNGTKVIVVTGRIKGFPDFEEKNNVKIFRTSLFTLKDLSHSSWLYILTALPFIFFTSLTHSRKVGLIHCHGFISAVMGYFLSLVTSRPLICTEQSLGWAKEKFSIVRRIVYGGARFCIASSNAVREEFLRVGVSGERIKVIPNGIDLALFTNKRAFTANRREFVILSVGRLEKIKGHKYLIDAFSQIKRDSPQARLTIIGDGSERKNLEAQVKFTGLSDVQFLGEVPHDDLPHYYHKADIFVMPSLSEGFGITAIEAMACGLSIVATSAGSLAELVRDRQSGLLVPPADTNALASAIRAVFTDFSFAASLAKEAVKRAQRYSWNKIANDVNDIYIEAASPKILAVASIFPPQIGGPAYYIHNLLREFENLGITAEILTGNRARSFKGIFFALRNVDICYTFSSSPKILIPVFFAAKLRGKKLALRIGGDFLWERAVEGGGTDLPLRLFYQQYKKSFREKLIFTILGFLFKRCDYLIFSSDSLRELYVNNYKLNTLRLYTIENPYPDIKKARRSFPQDLVMLYAGRLIKLKNVKLLLEAVKELQEELGKNIKLKIIGEGPKKQELKDLAQELDMQDAVIFQQTLVQADLLEEIKNSWLVALPSFSDITPNLIYESCGVGTPVAVTRENFLPVSILEGLMTFDPNNKNELKMAALWLTDPQRWQEYQQKIIDLDTSWSFADAAKEHAALFFKNYASI